jgi:hypothetical protein
MHGKTRKNQDRSDTMISERKLNSGHSLPPASMPHPLEPVVLEIASRVGLLDVPKLAHELCGCCVFRGRRAASGNRAYHIVAEDVLGYMFNRGRLAIRHDGWYEVIELPLEESSCS